ncbi:hypothetical protein HANVADRAFT_22115 [Hanseniaspora valbyensis NRRL Y-1626]|uniref:Translation initiation factor eIF2B subunit gamma n=1 Tax=Hanseniaspora valbyensis NRRL Y-1626 TaxID=766949 RepID=A0A1B7THB0_9ASCO|nr:hypothetical protein HANVADRAFT_22115 [Hanseniaspora valbyensis NRRL Y-1626]
MSSEKYQAFVLLNSSNNGKQPQYLAPLTSIVNNNANIKEMISDAILPVANRPMIHYVLDWCEQALFNEINLVIYDENITKLRETIQPFIDLRWEMYKTTLKDQSIKVDDNITIKEPVAINIITTKYKNEGEILMKTLANKIGKKFVLLPSDFITDLPPQILTHQFFQFTKFNNPKKQLNKTNDDIIMMSCFYKSQQSQVEKKKSNKNDYVLYNQLDRSSPYANVFLDSYTTENIEKQKYLKIRESLLWKFSKVKGSNLLIDSGMYFCNQKVVEIIRQISKQKINFVHRPLKKIFRDLARRSWLHSQLKERIAMFIIPNVVNFSQMNTITSYLETNRFMLNLIQENNPKVLDLLDASANDSVNEQQPAGVSQQSQIGNKTVLMTHSNVKKSLIGDNCKIGKKSKIIGSILLDNVEIDDNCIIENCIIGYNARIKRKSKLVNCHVEGGFIVPENGMFKGDVLKRDDLDLVDEDDEKSEDGKKSLLYGDNDILEDDDSDDDDDEEETGSENDYYDEELEDAGDFQFGF